MHCANLPSKVQLIGSDACKLNQLRWAALRLRRQTLQSVELLSANWLVWGVRGVDWGEEWTSALTPGTATRYQTHTAPTLHRWILLHYLHHRCGWWRFRLAAARREAPLPGRTMTKGRAADMGFFSGGGAALLLLLLGRCCCTSPGRRGRSCPGWERVRGEGGSDRSRVKLLCVGRSLDVVTVCRRQVLDLNSLNESFPQITLGKKDCKVERCRQLLVRPNYNWNKLINGSSDTCEWMLSSE